MASAANSIRNGAPFLSVAAAEAARFLQRGVGGPFGAVIVRRGRIIARGHNTVLQTNDPTCHAEMNALRAASRRLKRFALNDCEIYSTTEPCPMCFSAIHWARLSRITYATTIADVRRLGFNELSISNRRLANAAGSRVKIRREPNHACRELLRAWSRLPKKRTY